MASAIGTYATLTGVKPRLSIDPADTSQDTLLQALCDQANGFIERRTGRVLAPIPLVSTTVAAPGVSAGATSVPLTTAAGFRLGDELMLGPVSGTHESAPVVAISGATITLGRALTSAYIAGTAAARCWMRDGFDAIEDGRLLLEPRGIVTIDTLEVGPYTGSGYATTPAGDFFLGPTIPEREPGFPATELWMTNIPSPGNQYPSFYPGFRTVRYGTGTVLGWPAIPDEIVDIALNIGVALFRARGASGGMGAVTVNIDGSRTFERMLSTKDWKTLSYFSVRQVEVI